MLAEKRSKQKWSADPRNTSWSEDRSKYGYRMLEKMGWSEGQGLGRDKDGQTEHVKVSRKSSNTGVGYTKGRDDDWIEHQTSFDQILAGLNAAKKTKEEGRRKKAELESEEEEEKKTERKEPGSLMNNAISSRRAVYKKVLRSKDLSSASREDLNCVFGRKRERADSDGTTKKKSRKKGKREEREEEEGGVKNKCEVSEDNQGEEVETDKTEEGRVEEAITSHGVTAILRTTTVQDYFSAKLERRNSKHASLYNSKSKLS